MQSQLPGSSAQRCFAFSLVLFLLFAGVQNAQAVVYKVFVTTTGAGLKNGTNWANAYDGTQLQIAINDKPSGEVWVAKGTYKPTTGTDRTIAFQMKNNTTIYGGFAGTELETGSASQRVTYGAGEANETILSGDIGTPDDNTDNSYNVIKCPDGLGLNSSAVLDGFTITLGNANGSYPNNGGGGMYNSNNTPTINNCRFKSNAANAGNCYGGAVYSINKFPIFNNCIFSSNAAANGAAIYCEFITSGTITNCIFSSNSATSGGGIQVYSATLTLNNCIVWGNTATTGKQFRLVSSSVVTLNYSCYANGTNDVSIQSGTFTASTNDITSNPQFVNASGGDYRVLGASPCVDAGNDAANTLSYDIRGSAYARKLDKTTGLAGTIDMGAYEYKVSADPLPVELVAFAATSSGGSTLLQWKTATEVNNSGFAIERRSPTTDWSERGFVTGAGSSTSPRKYSFRDTKLAGGSYSYRLKQVDNGGAFKYSAEAAVTIGVPRIFALEQNYPNPFNPSTTISFTLAEDVHVSLRIFDLVGREVKTVIDGNLTAGKLHAISFNASDLSSGIYFYRLQTGKNSITKKMLLTK